MDWVSFDEIKKTVTLQMAIEHYGIPLRRVNANTLRGKCPLPTHGSEKSKESFTATLNKGVGGAWACQSQSCIKSRGRVGGNVLSFRRRHGTVFRPGRSDQIANVVSGSGRGRNAHTGWQGTSRGNFRGQGTGAANGSGEK